MTKFEEYRDSALIEGSLAGHNDCFSALMKRHAEAVKRHIRPLLPSPEDSEDVMQEAMFKVWRHLSSFRGESGFRTWMSRVAANEALMLYRKPRARSLSSHAEAEIPAPPEQSPERALIRHEKARAVQHACRRLPRTHREVLFLRDIREMNSRDTAQTLGITVAAVKSRLFRARLELSVALQSTAASSC